MLNELKHLPNWLCWSGQEEKIAGRAISAKAPRNPRTGKLAKPNDPETWGTYDEAIKGAKRFGYFTTGGGIGFIFSSENDYAGIDLDGVLDGKGNFKFEWAKDVFEMMDSYTEYSPSKTGLHIIIKCDMKLLDTFKTGFHVKFSDDGHVGFEFYSERHFITVTGNIFGEAKPIKENSEVLAILCKKYFKEKDYIKNYINLSGKNSQISDKSDNKLPDLSDTNRYCVPSNLDCNFVLRYALDNDKTNFVSLFNGEGIGKSESEADMAFVNRAIFWTRGNPEWIDYFYRHSLRRRDKWDEVHYSNGDTYGKRTIENALSTYSGNMFDWVSYQERKFQKKTAFDDFKEVRKLEGTVFDYLRDSLMDDLKIYWAQAKNKTGFANIDVDTSLYSGLYVIGAPSSLGKTTFCHQMADQLAKNGRKVLFFSLEQSQCELVTKGLSRECFLLDLETLKGDWRDENYVQSVAPSAIEIRSGFMGSDFEVQMKKELFEKAIEEYKKFGANEKIIEGGFGTDIAEIGEIIEKNASNHPVIFVDYLQAIKPLDKYERLTEKQITDRHMQHLKELSKKHKLTIFVISSFNRVNYTAPVDFESFKESGGIEYTADVVLGFQLSALSACTFHKDDTKREFLKDQRKRTTRNVEIVVLKNRYGKTQQKYIFDYLPKFDYFRAVDKQDVQRIYESLRDSYANFKI